MAFSGKQKPVLRESLCKEIVSLVFRSTKQMTLYAMIAKVSQWIVYFENRKYLPIIMGS